MTWPNCRNPGIRRSRLSPVKPLPRLWKTEPDEDEEEELKEAAEAKRKRPRRSESAQARARDPEARLRARKQTQGAQKPAAAEGARRRCWWRTHRHIDTYEARQRGRLIIGGLIAGCFRHLRLYLLQSVHLRSEPHPESTRERNHRPRWRTAPPAQEGPGPRSPRPVRPGPRICQGRDVPTRPSNSWKPW